MTGLRKSGSLLSTALAASVLLAGGFSHALKAQNKPTAQPLVLFQPESILGKDLVSASGQSAGRIVDVLADESGQVRAVVVDYGGFLGVGSRKIAIAWTDLRFGQDVKAGVVMVDIPSDRLSRAPEVKAGEPVVVLSAHPPAGNAPAAPE